MTDRAIEKHREAKARADDYMRSVAQASPAEKIAKAKELLDGGAITQSELDQIKQRASAG